MAEENKKEKNVVKAEKKVKTKDGKEKMKLTDRIKKFFRDYKSEIKKIVWPTKDDVFQSTGVVLIAIIFVAIIVGVLDLVFGLGVNALSGI
jgi:preprotein translocase subunit SecE